MFLELVRAFDDLHSPSMRGMSILSDRYLGLVRQLGRHDNSNLVFLLHLRLAIEWLGSRQLGSFYLQIASLVLQLGIVLVGALQKLVNPQWVGSLGC
jgi:hypothetical protein